LTSLKKQYYQWQEITGEEHRWSAPFVKLKFRYEYNQWQQVQPRRDIFNNLDDVKVVCGNGDDVKEIACWLDTYHWSLMKQSKVTEDIYQFINHRAQVMRAGVDKEIDNFAINEEMRKELIDSIVTKINSTLEALCL
jgi:uncharacterized protein YnzC (UPF0291/DUF896 family)